MTTDILNVDELTAYLKAPKQTIYKLVQRSGLPSFKVGKQLRFRKSRIDKWIEEKERKRSKKSKRKRGARALD